MASDATKKDKPVSEQEMAKDGEVSGEHEKEQFEEDCEPCETDFRSLPPIDFTSFVFSLSTSTMIYLGVLPETEGVESKVDLAMAKQHIDILGMLQERTKGNLTQEEADFLERSLYDLRLRFVTACSE
ncbi:MAG: DUF1844 domain-containing protein [Candidatus Lernaella stagnicola]|nr:DUF1844 domain-containing protein [Candidatus Lernaella stagnicola]